MGKPMLVFKRFGHQIHLMVQGEFYADLYNSQFTEDEAEE